MPDPMKLARQSLEDDFVRLEMLDETHREPLRVLAADPSLWVQTSLNAATHFDEWFETMVHVNQTGAQLGYAVFDKRRNAYAGHTSFLMIAPEHQRVEIGWTWYGTGFHRTHVNPACKRLLMEHAFSCGAERVELKTGSKNLRSQRAMEKMGAIREGTLRSHSPAWTGERRDSVFYSVLRNEWDGVRTKLDQRLEGADND